MTNYQRPNNQEIPRPLETRGECIEITRAAAGKDALERASTLAAWRDFLLLLLLLPLFPACSAAARPVVTFSTPPPWLTRRHVLLVLQTREALQRKDD